jgi:hypothetical protein
MHPADAERCGECGGLAAIWVRREALCWACQAHRFAVAAEGLRVEFLRLTAANGRLEAENARLAALVEAHELTFRALDAAVKERKEGR